ncbi:GNAT family N-acetyltransferase [Pseudonocardia spinosispora]|uniref:GNAT family N-acetyltransferase n=1 Tax=Pseudonocardia spinosispora TaxID=103441 RepID=UPI000403E748|nr:GNAT family protein [Pseudonocardia spinosispora]
MMMHRPRWGLARTGAPASTELSGTVGRKVRLREIAGPDLRTLIRFDRDAARGGDPRIGGYRHWAAHRAAAEDPSLQFAIETLRGGMLVGSVCAIEADPSSGRFSYGIGIGPRHRRCGYAGDAIAILLGFMFTQRGYRECEVSIFGGNLSSLSLHQGLGFREEGRSRDTELLHGGIKDLVRMGIDAERFTELHPDFAGPGGPEGTRRGRHWRRTRGRHWYAEVSPS